MKQILLLIKKHYDAIGFVLIYSLLFYLYTRFFGILLPVTAGALLAVIGSPICRKADRSRMLRRISPQMTTALLAAVLTSLLFFFVFFAFREAHRLRESLPVFDIQNLHPRVRRFAENIVTKLSDYVRSTNLSELLLPILPSTGTVLKHLTILPAVFIFPVLSFLFCFVFIKNKRKLQCILPEVIGMDRFERLRDAVRQRAANASGFFFSYAVIYLSTFVEAVIVLFLFNIRYPTLTALAVTVSDVFPILGPGFIFLPLCVYRLLCGDYISSIGIFVGWITITVIRQIIEPRLISKVTKAPGTSMLFSFYAALLSGNFWIIPYTAILFFLFQLFKEAGVIKNTGQID